MATATSKIDAAAEKAFADAAEKKAAETAKAEVSAKKVEKAVAADKPAPVKAEKVAKAVAAPAEKKKAAAKKAAPKKKATPVKRVAKKTPAKKAANKIARKTAAKKAAPKKTAKKAASDTNTISKLKDTIMAKANTNDITKTVKEAAADMQERVKGAYDKGAEIAADVNEFNKGNIEALVESGKILAAGVQDMGRNAIEDTKAAAETVTEDVKKMAAVKSPTELFQLQGEIARRNFDAAIAQTSKNAETMMKLATDVWAPLSSRASVATEKFSKAA